MILKEIFNALGKKELEANFQDFEYKNLKINGKVLIKNNENEVANDGFAKITVKNEKEEKILEICINNREKKIEIVVFKILTLLKDLSFIKFVLKMRRLLKKSENYSYKFKFNFKLLRK